MINDTLSKIVKNKIGSSSITTANTCEKIGQFTLSKDESIVYVTNTNGLLELYNFDRCNGTIDSFITFGMRHYCLNSHNYYGISISSNNKNLYVSSFNELFQIQLDSSKTISNVKIIYQDSISNRIMGQHKLGPDGKIYITNTFKWGPPTNFADSFNTHLSVIEHPDSPGLACSFKPYSFSLGGRIAYLGLPNLPDYTISPLPSYQADAGENLFVCTGDSIQIGKAVVPGIVYHWQGNGITQTYAAQPLVAPDSSSMYVLTITDTAGNYSCSVRNDTVWVFAVPNPVAAATNDTTICAGDSVVLEAIGGEQYQWFPNSFIQNSDSSNAIVFPVTGTQYFVEVRNQYGCKDTASVFIATEPLPEINSIQRSGDTLFIENPSSNQIQWLQEGQAITNETDSFFIPGNNGVYSVLITDSLGCSAVSDSFEFIKSGIKGVQEENGFSVYPNPAKTNLIVELKNFNLATLQLYNSIGELCLIHKVKKGINSISIEQLPSGVYTYELQKKTQSHFGKLLIVR